MTTSHGTGVELATKILLVEDNPDDAVLVRDVLAEADQGFSLVWVTSIEEAIAHLRECDVDVVILDLLLPGSVGMETISRLRQQAPHVPVVVLTGMQTEALTEAQTAHGVRSLLSKFHMTEEGYLERALRFAISRRQADRALVLAEERLMVALEASSAGIWTLDLATDEMRFDGPVHYRGEIGRARLSRADFLDAIDSMTRPTIEAALCGTPGRELLVEYRVDDSQGRRRQIRIGGRVAEDGRTISGICWDVTQTRQLEHRVAEAEKYESLKHLAGGVAHDFNNLLTTILGNIDLARKEWGSDHSAQVWMQEIETAAMSAGDLTKQLLAYSGGGRFIVQKVDLSSLVRETEALIRSALGPNTKLRLDLSPRPLTVQADAIQLRQVLLNLVRNGSEALGGGDGTVTVSSGLWQPGGDVGEGFAESDPMVMLEVADTGSGMSAETRDQLFEPFFSTKVDGRGLGLAAVRGIVRGHGGRIQVRSVEGKGTTMRVLLPLAQPLEEWTHPKCRGRVLVADDDPAVLAVVSRILHELGFEVIGAADGQEALDLYKVHDGELALLLFDVSMPRITGSEAITRLATEHNDLPPVVFMSGYAQPDSLGGFDERPVGFLPKPFQSRELERAIEQALDA